MHLLAATDFSEPAGFAVDRAAALAALHPEASLTVMHVHPTEGLEVVRQLFRTEIEEIERKTMAHAEGRLRAAADQCEKTLGRSVGTRLMQGRAETGIIDAAKELAADVILMGETGRSGVPFLGGTIERVLQRANCSVLVVKRRPRGAYRRAVVGVRSSLESRSAAEQAFALNPGAELILLHAYEAPAEDRFRRAGASEGWIKEYRLQSRGAAEGELARLAARLEAEGVLTRLMVVQGAPAAAIVEHSQGLGADLAVVGKNKLSGFGDLLFGNVARRVAVDSEVDVLVAAPLRA